MEYLTALEVSNQLLPTHDSTRQCLCGLPFKRGSSSTGDLNTTASASNTGIEWASGSDGQEPDNERTTALITGEVLFCTG